MCRCVYDSGSSLVCDFSVFQCIFSLRSELALFMFIFGHVLEWAYIFTGLCIVFGHWWGETGAPHNYLIAGATDACDRRVIPVGEVPPARKLCGGLVYVLGEFLGRIVCTWDRNRQPRHVWSDVYYPYSLCEISLCIPLLCVCVIISRRLGGDKREIVMRIV